MSSTETVCVSNGNPDMTSDSAPSTSSDMKSIVRGTAKRWRISDSGTVCTRSTSFRPALSVPERTKPPQPAYGP